MKSLWFNIRYILYCNMYFIHYAIVMIALYLIVTKYDLINVLELTELNEYSGGWKVFIRCVAIPLALSIITSWPVFRFIRKWSMDTENYRNTDGIPGILMFLVTLAILIYILSEVDNGYVAAFSLITFAFTSVLLYARYLFTYDKISD